MTISTRYKAFTLLEILVLIGLLLGISMVIFPYSVKDIKKDQARSYSREMASNIFVQQQNAYSGLNDEDYGIYLTNKGYTLFTGDDYATGEVSMEVNLPADTYLTNNLGGANEIVFSKGSIRPSNAGNIILTTASESYGIYINAEGLIEVIRIE